VLIVRADDGLLLWESFRRTPEGLTCGIVRHEAAKETLLRYAASLEGEEKPEIAVLPGLPSKIEAQTLFGTGVFDYIIVREPWRGEKDPRAAFARFAQAARDLLAAGGAVCTLQSPPESGQRLSAFIPVEQDALSARLAAAEDAFFGDPAQPWSWTTEDVTAAFAAAGFSTTVTDIAHREERIVGAADLAHWFDHEKSPWGKFIFEKIGENDFTETKNQIGSQTKTGPLVWQWRSVLVKAGEIAFI
jgi:putative ATPase